ncbi:hypothetical protein DFJ73DRAFT_6485 [Zopfochytrium polystomum]|nr:hypothetical protein DFJ73DRAFT_6485 [Zopfochytrium polystomum]
MPGPPEPIPRRRPPNRESHGSDSSAPGDTVHPATADGNAPLPFITVSPAEREGSQSKGASANNRQTRSSLGDFISRYRGMNNTTSQPTIAEEDSGVPQTPSADQLEPATPLSVRAPTSEGRNRRRTVITVASEAPSSNVPVVGGGGGNRKSSAWGGWWTATWFGNAYGNNSSVDTTSAHDPNRAQSAVAQERWDDGDPVHVREIHRCGRRRRR